MEITCECGAVNYVDDADQWQDNRCSECQAHLPVNSGHMTNQAPSAEEDLRECPFCSEMVKRKAKICRHCGEALKVDLTPEDQKAMRDEAIMVVDAFLGDIQMQEDDRVTKGGFMSVKTIVLAVLTAVFGIMFAVGMGMGSRDGGGIAVLGAIFGGIFLLSFIVSIMNDKAATNISSMDKPEKVIKAWLMALRTNRAKKAYVALAPSGRLATDAKSVPLERIPEHKGLYSIADPKSLYSYWKSVFTGPSSYIRQVRIKKVKAQRPDRDGFAPVDVMLEFTSYPSILLALAPFALLPVAILIAIIQKKETQVMRKMLLQRQGTWVVLDGQYQGLIDLVD